jgi:endonuclease/exonuclease/phosphatase (EEP) superfamily protein YafD
LLLLARKTLTAEPTDTQETHSASQETFFKITKHIPATAPAQQTQPVPTLQQLSENKIARPIKHVLTANAKTLMLFAIPIQTAEPTDILALHIVNQEMFTKFTNHIPATTPAPPQPAVQVQQTTS